MCLPHCPSTHAHQGPGQRLLITGRCWSLPGPGHLPSQSQCACLGGEVQGAQSLLLCVAPQSTFSKKKLSSNFLKNIDMEFKVTGKSLEGVLGRPEVGLSLCPSSRPLNLWDTPCPCPPAPVPGSLCLPGTWLSGSGVGKDILSCWGRWPLQGLEPTGPHGTGHQGVGVGLLQPLESQDTQ